MEDRFKSTSQPGNSGSSPTTDGPGTQSSPTPISTSKQRESSTSGEEILSPHGAALLLTIKGFEAMKEDLDYYIDSLEWTRSDINDAIRRLQDIKNHLVTELRQLERTHHE